jgi:hypothetical protein
MAYPTDPPYSEKRESPRINWIDSEVKVSISSSHTNSKILGWIRDISQGGFKLQPETPVTRNGLFRESDEIHFETFEDFFHLKGEGRVIWASPSENTIGIRIDHLDEGSRIYLYGFLGIPPIL